MTYEITAEGKHGWTVKIADDVAPEKLASELAEMREDDRVTRAVVRWVPNLTEGKR